MADVSSLFYQAVAIGIVWAFVSQWEEKEPRLIIKGILSVWGYILLAVFLFPFAE